MNAQRGDSREIPPCVMPRRRFIVWCLWACVLCAVASMACYGACDPESVALLFWAVILLSVPARSRGGTLLQLLGLMLPVGLAGLSALSVVIRHFGEQPWMEYVKVFFGSMVLVWWLGAPFIILGVLVCLVFSWLRKRFSGR